MNAKTERCVRKVWCAEQQLILLFWRFPQVCDSSWSSGHRLYPHITKMIVSTTHLNDAIRTLRVVPYLVTTGSRWQTSPKGLMRGPGKAPDEHQKGS